MKDLVTPYLDAMPEVSPEDAIKIYEQTGVMFYKNKILLCGTIIVYNCIKTDYSYKEAIRCLVALCDYVIVVDCGSTDGTAESLKEFESPHLEVIYRDKSEWDLMQGRTKLSYFTNIAIDRAKELGYEWQINLQADEVIGEYDFPAIRQAINNPVSDSYWTRRINLWGNSKWWLDVPDGRKPVGDIIIRLTNTKYHSIDDAQSIDAQHGSFDFLDKIRFWHVGFIRDSHKHVEKIRHMLVDVFQLGMDKNVEAMTEGFNPMGMGFTKEDLKPVTEPLPIFIQDWCAIRDEINNINI